MASLSSGALSPHALTTRWDSQLASQSSRRLNPHELVVLVRPTREKDGQQKDISAKESPNGLQT
jgi:hypothetical protein